MKKCRTLAWKLYPKAISRPKFHNDITAYIVIHVNNNFEELLKELN